MKKKTTEADTETLVLLLLFTNFNSAQSAVHTNYT